MPTPANIERLLIMGDSLSDQGEMNQRRLFGIIPMNRLADLKQKSPAGRFTNGFPWSDQVLVDLANDYNIKQLEEVVEGRQSPSGHGFHSQSVQEASATVDALIENPVKKAHLPRHASLNDLRTGISDGVIDGDQAIRPVVEKSYSLDMKLKHNNLQFKYQGQVLARSYAQGGLTAHDYSWTLSSSMSRFFSRLVLATLGQKRNQVFTDDIAERITPEEKQKTLVVEWSGANDLITVNKRPSHAEVDKAIEGRIKNAKELIEHGYRHFVLFNLPNLGLTPRYQNKGLAEQKNADDCSVYFNTKFKQACLQLASKHPDCSIEVFDVASTLDEVYHRPEQYGFDPLKQKQPYTTSKDFKITKTHTSPGAGYMFWDDVHPSMALQSILANRFYEKYSKQYQFTKPKVTPQQEVNEASREMTEQQLFNLFKETYQKAFPANNNAYSGFFKSSRLPKGNDLAEVIEDALYHGDHRSFKVMMDLGWFDKNKHLVPNIPELIDAKEKADADHVDQVAPTRGGYRLIQ